MSRLLAVRAVHVNVDVNTFHVENHSVVIVDSLTLLFIVLLGALPGSVLGVLCIPWTSVVIGTSRHLVPIRVTLTGGVADQTTITSGVVVLEPWIGPQLSTSWSIVRIHLHGSLYDTSWARGHIVRDLQVSCLDLGVQLFVVCSSKWELAAEEGEEQDT